MGEVAEFNPKTTLPAEFEYVDLESVIGTEMISHQLISLKKAPSRAQRLAERGDVFYQMVRPYQKNNYLFDLDANNYVFSTGYAQMRPYGDSSFLLARIQEERFVSKVLERSTGTSYPAINSNDLERISINVPKIEEQSKIGKFFNTLDSLIAANQRKLEKTKALKSAYLSEMFPSRDKNKPKMRFSGFTDAWEQRKFKDFISKSGEKNRNGEDFPAYSVSNQLGLIPQTEQFEGSRLDNLDKTAYKFVKPNEFAYNPARINVGSIAFNDIDKTVIVSSLYVVLQMSDKLDNEYALQYIKSSEFLNEVRRNTEGSVREYLFYANFKNIKLPYSPNIEEQRRIGKFFKNLDALITLHQRKLEELQELKKAYLQQMFI